ncbi:MAG: VOC family protein [Pseudomonadales bacterium]|jgi:catechol 2,3-dioxygenase-like lactoylglutathione lyase family enzyme|nr:VOC family protein [Pseudomonadales bacterium]
MTAPETVRRPPFRALRLDHLVLRARDIETLVAFYRDVLGCEVERVLPELGLHQLRAGDALIDLVDAQGPLGRADGAPPARADGGNLDHFCLRIEPFDAAALAAWLDAAGIAHEAPARRYGADGFGPSIYLADPEGNRVELKGPPEADPRG